MYSQRILVLGGYGTVGTVVMKDLVQSGFVPSVWGRNPEKMDALAREISEVSIGKEVLSLDDHDGLVTRFKSYDMIVNCLEYSQNERVIRAAAEARVSYIDLWDNYNWIERSLGLDAIFRNNKKTACLGAGSAPWIINVLIAFLTRHTEKVQTVVVSFSDILYKKVENMLPFNFFTVTEEILDDALIFEHGKSRFVPWSSFSLMVDFWKKFWKNLCYATNHDETYSLPLYLKDKWIENVFFVMKHDDVYLDLVPKLQKFWFLSREAISIGNTEIRPLDFTAHVMSQFLPKNFESDDTEMLYAKVDDDTISCTNTSLDGVPAGIINTGIGASLIAQYILKHDDTPYGVSHPEFLVDPYWIVWELIKRKFEILVNDKNIIGEL